MRATGKFTSADLLLLPQDNKRYEVIDGEFYISRCPSVEHQYTCARLGRFLDVWNDRDAAGAVLNAPGVIFSDDNDVVPDVVWVSRERLAKSLDKAGHLTAAPELVIEVLSPGKANEERDRQAKLQLYSRRGVGEYWIVDWMFKRVEVFRRRNARLELAATLYPQDELTSPLLAGFACRVADLFFPPLS